MTAIEKGAELLHNTVIAAMQEDNNEKDNVDIIDLAENIKAGIGLTREYQSIIMRNFEDTEPNPHKLEYIYNTTHTLGYIMFDRLIALEQLANKLVDKAYGKI